MSLEVENNIPLVSICCLTYNHESYIKQALDSFLMQQTNFAFEIVIHDDASTDNTAKIIEEYTQKYPKIFKPLLQTENQRSKFGGGMNPRFNFPRARGKYIAVCEGDDYWTDLLKLQKQVDFLESNTEYVLCFHKIKILKPNGELVDDFITKVPKKHQNLIDLAGLGNYIHTPSVMFKNILKEFPEEFFRSPFGDFFIYLLLAEHGKLHHIEENMAVYRYGVGVHSTKSKLKMAKISNLFFINYLSYSNNKEVNKVIFEKQLMSYDKFEQLVKEDCNLLTLFENYKQKLHYIFIKIKKKIKTIK